MQAPPRRANAGGRGGQRDVSDCRQDLEPEPVPVELDGSGASPLGRVAVPDTRLEVGEVVVSAQILARTCPLQPPPSGSSRRARASSRPSRLPALSPSWGVPRLRLLRFCAPNSTKSLRGECSPSGVPRAARSPSPARFSIGRAPVDVARCSRWRRRRSRSSAWSVCASGRQPTSLSRWSGFAQSALPQTW